MRMNLHANATTTPKTRAYIQASTAGVAELATELGVHPKTIYRWKRRNATADHSSRPKRIATAFSPLEEELVCALRRQLDMPLDDIVEVMRRCVKDTPSRSAVHRCLQRHGIAARPRSAKRAKVLPIDAEIHKWGPLVETFLRKREDSKRSDETDASSEA